MAAVLIHRRSWVWLVKLAKHAIDWVMLKDNDAAGARRVALVFHVVDALDLLGK